MNFESAFTATIYAGSIDQSINGLIHIILYYYVSIKIIKHEKINACIGRNNGRIYI